VETLDCIATSCKGAQALLEIDILRTLAVLLDLGDTQARQRAAQILKTLATHEIALRPIIELKLFPRLVSLLRQVQFHTLNHGADDYTQE
jgi:hypothetical protein